MRPHLTDSLSGLPTNCFEPALPLYPALAEGVDLFPRDGNIGHLRDKEAKKNTGGNKKTNSAPIIIVS